MSEKQDNTTQFPAVETVPDGAQDEEAQVQAAREDLLAKLHLSLTQLDVEDADLRVEVAKVAARRARLIHQSRRAGVL